MAGLRAIVELSSHQDTSSHYRHHPFPIRASCVAAGILWTLGDVIAQKKVEGRAKIDKKRLLTTAAYATCVVGPVGHAWYSWLDRFACKHFIPGTLKFVGAKVLIDEVVFTPIHVGVFFTLLTVADGGGMAEVQSKLQKDYLCTLLAELIVWPGFQALNFLKLPVKHQLLAANGATILDSTFLSWARSQEDWLAVATSALRSKSPGDDTTK